MGNEEGLGVTTGQPNLYKQDLSKLDVSRLTALSPEVISRQATINIGTIGHVAHGKSTIVKAISGVQTVRFKNELERNITIKLDAADSSSESTDIPGSIDSETSVVTHKRHVSSARCFDAPSRKMPKIHNTVDRNNISRRSSSSNTLCSSSSSSSLASLLSSSSSTSMTTRQAMRCQQMLEAFDDSSSTRSGSTSARDPSSDGRQSDYEELLSDSRFFTRGDIMTPHLDFKLKEVRVLLYDVLRSKKYQKLVTATLARSSSASNKKMKVWEVEKILQKREYRGQTHYLIKWKNWDVNHNSWEPLRNLISCEDLLREFEDDREKLVNQFKAMTNFYPDLFDVQLFLVRTYDETNRSIIDATNDAAVAIAGDSMYAEIRRYLKNSHNTELENKIKRQMLFMLLIDLRHDQLESLEEWERSMNRITKGKPTIQVENLVDLEGAPQDFCYIDNYLPGEGVVIPEDPPIGCECEGVCGTGKKSDCCFAQNNVKSLPFTSARRIRVSIGIPIYECNNRCTCDGTCPNRVVQRGTDAQLCIFRTDNGRGWGVRTRRAIKKGTFVIKYVGEVVTNEEADRRGRRFNLTGRTYLFDLDYDETDGPCPYTVDAASYGNVSHFINHSCDPNLAVWAIWINCLDPSLPSLALFAIKDIKQNEELTFDYMCQTPRDNVNREDEPGSDSATLKNRMLCKCGAATCRQYLF